MPLDQLPGVMGIKSPNHRDKWSRVGSIKKHCSIRGHADGITFVMKAMNHRHHFYTARQTTIQIGNKRDHIAVGNQINRIVGVFL